MERKRIWIFLLAVVLIVPQAVDGWYYNCFVESSVILEDGCNLKNIVVAKDIDAENIYFPPTNINFFQSNFSTFSPALGRRLAVETESVHFYNCLMPKFAIPLAVKRIGIFFNNLQTVYSNYLLENQLELLIIMNTKITNIRFVEVLNKLRFLRIVGNPIRYVDFGRFRNLTALEHIDLSENQIYNIDPGSEPIVLPNLVKLFLHKNFLIEFDSSMWYFPSLYSLKLHKNFMRSMNVKELDRAAPQLGEISLSENLWSCRRFTAVIRHLSSRNITYLDDEAKTNCNSIDHYQYVTFSALDDITETRLMLARLNSTASEHYQNAKSEVLIDVLKRNDAVESGLTELEAGLRKLFIKYNKLKLWILNDRS
ncbi:uncharacterized protein LOC129778868 [Toxorhynchites rutilus septentrionalis]|uniref:uncharacterized protein LOC129778868 n=1 Tax=Toxorhynchites rutilus septentrionalis TaxID=329112 RepID=UPI0024787861|nr:uncharacterized protein LOC129778868 [Toxorhynchites rutilus septentrionalis]